MEDVTKWPRKPTAAKVPHKARVFASLPPEVSTTSSASAPNSRATVFRAAARASAASRPAPWRLDGLPTSWCPFRTACAARGCSGAAAA
ncbi:Uncharacterised protein [Mycobacteroides abscessus subsp. abscessus]|nr:Uncharacterised protein [Mycobacteroides abscessus subsp. abscessus]